MRQQKSAPLPHPPSGYEVSAVLPIPGPDAERQLRYFNNVLGLCSAASVCLLVREMRAEYRTRQRLFRSLTNPTSLLGAALVRHPLLAAHEGIHVLLLWAFTRELPRFSVIPRNGYAYAAAPGWYFPRSHYLVIGLGPLAVLTPILIALLRLAPAWAVPAVGRAIVGNIAGSNADIYVAWQLLRRPPNHYIHDTGEVFSFWAPGSADGQESRPLQ